MTQRGFGGITIKGYTCEVMTKDEQGKEIADRIARLSSIRGELVVSRAYMKKSIDLLAAVGQLMQTSQNRVWPR